MTSRSLQEIEQDVATIDQALIMVSEMRTSLKNFVNLALTEPKSSNYVKSFKLGLTTIRTDIGRLESTRKNMEGALYYAQQAAGKNEFDWSMIKESVQNEKEQEEGDIQDESVKSKPKDLGLLIKTKADCTLQQLSKVVLKKPPISGSENDLPIDDQFLKSYVKYWMSKEKPKRVQMTISTNTEERKTVVGSLYNMSITICMIMKATLELEYDRKNDSLIIHHFDIKGSNDEDVGSRHLVFQKINLLATDAFKDMLKLSIKEALSSILHWLSSYHNLFEEPCHRCHRRLEYDSPQFKFLPPVVRTWARRTDDLHKPSQNPPDTSTSTGIAYHMRCFKISI